jgi:hypothetical protein
LFEIKLGERVGSAGYLSALAAQRDWLLENLQEAAEKFSVTNILGKLNNFGLSAPIIWLF